jgi:hypothetical protein
MANVHAVVLSPLNISLPTLIILKVGCPKITNKILRLSNANRLALNQAYASLLTKRLLKERKKEEKRDISPRLKKYKIMPGRPSLPGYQPDFLLSISFLSS